MALIVQKYGLILPSPTPKAIKRRSAHRGHARGTPRRRGRIGHGRRRTTCRLGGRPHGQPPEREMDSILLSAGERISMAAIAAINELGVGPAPTPARRPAWTDSHFGARPDHRHGPRACRPRRQGSQVAIVAPVRGISKDDDDNARPRQLTTRRRPARDPPRRRAATRTSTASSPPTAHRPQGPPPAPSQEGEAPGNGRSRCRVLHLRAVRFARRWVPLRAPRSPKRTAPGSLGTSLSPETQGASYFDATLKSPEENAREKPSSRQPAHDRSQGTRSPSATS